MTAGRILDALDPEQRTAVLAPCGPVCIVAGAGTGKTRTITHRVAHLVATEAVAPQHVLCVTFTARAAGELRGRLRALAGRGSGVERVQARTFHAAALRQLTYFWPRAVGGAMPSLLDNKFGLVSAAAGRSGLRVSNAEVRDLIGEIEWAKARMFSAEQYAAAATAAGRESPWPVEEVAAVYAAYEDAKSRNGLHDFDDLLLLTAGVIETHEDIADEVHARYRHLVVDEYQDVNPLQQRLLDAWLGGRDDLCVVGDDDQTIYSFTGADRGHLLQFPRRFPGATVVRLVRDYRSTPQVVELANRVIAGDTTRRGPAKTLVAQQPAGPAPLFAEHGSEPEEARWVTAQVRALVDAGTPLSEVAVLYRVNAQSQAYEAALAAAGVPYLVRGGERFFERREVREAVAALRGAARVDEPEPLLQRVHAALKERLDWRPDGAPSGAGAARDRWDALAAIVGIAADLANGDPTAGLAVFVAELDQRIADQHAPAVAGVTLASLHAAKGLEWDAVFLVGLADGTMPIQHATTPEQVAEERRLLYVGITRARRHLGLSWALARAEGGRRTRSRSRFLDGLAGAPERVVAERSGRPRRTVAQCRVCSAPLRDAAARHLRRCADCPATMDEALFERLRDWRKGRAGELGQPAYCVFTDLTLTAIAEGRPTSVDELAAIPGVGPTKLDKFGQEVLALVSNE
ncbi:MAG TPA: ATP-dependent DNA helicase UvrD2 [Mycobacteriales bacterium]|nr:ATP-dependent DNA helicase UvrD2 [Mycobacteriales bacterium]